MRSPATAGPTMVPTWNTIWLRAAADDWWRGPTSVADEAARAELDTPMRPPATALTTYTTHTAGWAATAFKASTPLVSASATPVTHMSERRSMASPTEPPASDPTMSGTSWARLTAPTWKDEWVSRKT